MKTTINSYITNRKFEMQTEGVTSLQKTNKAGVPQGSVLDLYYLRFLYRIWQCFDIQKLHSMLMIQQLTFTRDKHLQF